MMESTEEIGLHVLYSPVSPVRPLNRFRNRAQHSLPDLRSKGKRFVRAFPRLFSIRVSLDAWPQTLRDNAQFAAGHLRGPQPDSQIRWPESNRVMPPSQCQAFSLSSSPFGRLGKITFS